jgi:hypothetical protein
MLALAFGLHRTIYVCSAPLVKPATDCSAVNSPRYLAPLSRADGFRDIRLHTYCST